MQHAGGARAAARLRRPGCVGEHRLGRRAIAARAGGDEAIERRQLVGGAVREQPRARCRGCRAARRACAACAPSARRRDTSAPCCDEPLDHRHVPAARRDVQRRFAVVAPGEVRVGAVIEQPARPARRCRPTASCRRAAARRRGCRSTFSAVAVQQFERGEIAAAAGDVRRDAVGRIRAGVEQHLGQRQMSDGADRAPTAPCAAARDASSSDTRRSGFGAERAAAAARSRRGRRRAPGVVGHAGVADVEQRLPLLRSARLLSRARDDRAAVPRPPRRRRGRAPSAATADAMRRMQREQPLARGRSRRRWRSGRTRRPPRRTTACATRLPRAARSTTGSRARARSPTARRAAPDRRRRSRRRLAGERRAARRSGASALGIARLRRVRAATWPASSVVRDSDERAVRVTAYNLHASALWFADRQHGGVGRRSRSYDGGLGPSREPAGALYAPRNTLCRRSSPCQREDVRRPAGLCRPRPSRESAAAPRRARFARPRPAAGAEQNQLRSVHLRLAVPGGRGEGRGQRASKKRSPARRSGIGSPFPGDRAIVWQALRCAMPIVGLSMSVIEWLLDSDPSIRWQVMRDLTGEPDATVARERSRVAAEGWGARLLDLQGAGWPLGRRGVRAARLDLHQGHAPAVARSRRGPGERSGAQGDRAGARPLHLGRGVRRLAVLRRRGRALHQRTGAGDRRVFRRGHAIVSPTACFRSS